MIELNHEKPMMIQLNPPMPLDTPKGKAMAHFLIDYGAEHDLLWVTFIDATGECWTWPNHKIRAQKNITLGRIPDEYAYVMNEKVAAPPVASSGMNGLNGHAKVPHTSALI